MKTLIVYFSQFGNTKRVAKAIAETLTQAGEARAISIDQFTAVDLNDVDLVVMGSPTHYQNLPKAFRQIFETLPKRSLRGEKPQHKYSELLSAQPGVFHKEKPGRALARTRDLAFHPSL